MSALSWLRERLIGVLESGAGDQRRPLLDRNRQSSVPGLYVVGDLAGAPVIKLAMEQGLEVIEHIVSLPRGAGRASVDAPAGGPVAGPGAGRRAVEGPGGGAPSGRGGVPGENAGTPTRAGARDHARGGSHADDPAGIFDVIVVGAGAAGLNAALAASDRGLSCLVLEKEKIASTIEDFPEGKWIYAEPDAIPPRGKLWLDGATKENLVGRWHAIIEENRLDVRTGEPLISLERRGGVFVLTTPKGEHRCRRIVLATGARGNPRRLEAPGEDLERVYHRLYSPKAYRGERILVVGGGNSAVEAALTLAERNKVVISYRGDRFFRIFKDNERKLDEAIAAGKIEVIFGSTVESFEERAGGLHVSPEDPVAAAARGAAPPTGGASPAGSAALAGTGGWAGAGRAVPSGRSPGESGPEGRAILQVTGADGGRGGSRRDVGFDHAFVLIGADVPVAFLRSLGIRLEGDWSGSIFRAAALSLAVLAGLWLWGGQAEAFGRDLPSLLSSWPGGGAAVGGVAALAGLAALVLLGARGDRSAWLGLTFLVCYTIYGAKVGPGVEFWPFRGWGHDALSLAGRPWSFWYTVLYTIVMTLFGLQAMKRWGLDRKDRFQIWRYVSLLGFQWTFFFLVPELLFQWAVKYQWVGERLATDPVFTEQAWRSYGIVYAWPLFFYTFFHGPHMVWVVWGAFLTFVLIPILVLFHGKRYCSWICGCGGLAETLGDRWRHLAPKGRASIRWEWMNGAVLAFATGATLLMLGRDIFAAFSAPADWAVSLYRIYADVWLVGILPVTLYPFLGGKIWCRYWCPLAKLMQIMSRAYTKLGIGRFAIQANEKCIACNECSRNCQVGIDVMGYALKQEVLDNANSSCIGCGICVTVCPMDTLSFGDGRKKLPVVS